MKANELNIPSGPVSVTLKVDNYSTEVLKNGVRIYKITCNASDFVALPIDANVRDPKEDSETVNAIIETLVTDPSKMYLRNLGLNVICSEVVEKSKNKLELTFKNEEGVLNGSHSQFGVLRGKGMCLPSLDEAQFEMRLFESANLSKEEIADIAACLNLSMTVSKVSLAEKKGLFDTIKRALPESYVDSIEFRGNSKEGCVHMDAEELIVLMDMFNLHSYKSQENKRITHPKTASSSKAKAFESEKVNYDYLSNVLKDILDMKEFIDARYTDIRETKSSLKLLPIKGATGDRAFLPFSGRKLDAKCPKEVYLPILASLRANLRVNEGTGLAEWITGDIKDFYINVESELWSSTLKTFKNEEVREVSNRLCKSTEHWSNLYNITARFVAEEEVRKSKEQLELYKSMGNVVDFSEIKMNKKTA